MKKLDQVLAHQLDIRGVNERKAEFHRALFYCNIRVLETVEDCCSMSLNSRVIDSNGLEKGVEGDITYVFVVVKKKSTENINRKYSEIIQIKIKQF